MRESHRRGLSNYIAHGEERIANAVRRDPGVSADVLCKSLLAAARDFASAPLTDDVAILAIRRV